MFLRGLAAQHRVHRDACLDKAPRAWKPAISSSEVAGDQPSLLDNDGHCRANPHGPRLVGIRVRMHMEKDRENTSFAIEIINGTKASCQKRTILRVPNGLSPTRTLPRFSGSVRFAGDTGASKFGPKNWTGRAQPTRRFEPARFVQLSRACSAHSSW